MIVNWKKENAGVLVLPCLENGVIDKYVTVLPGHNEVDNKDWAIARKAAARILKSGDLVELVELRTTKLDGKEKSVTKFKGNLDFENNFPYNEILTVMKNLDIYMEITALKLQETGKKSLTKAWLLEYFQDWEEGEVHWDKIQQQFGESENETDKEMVNITLDDLEPKEARDVILETYNLKTLDYWLSTISQPDLRVLIMNQITSVNEPPKRR